MDNLYEQLCNEVADLVARVAEVERRAANTQIHGPVTHVDAAKQLARIRLGGTDDEPWLSPWLPYRVNAGAFKSVVHPSEGQTMTLRAPAGELRQGTLEPMAFSDQYPSPSTDKDKHVILDFNGAQISVDKEALILKYGDNVSLTIKNDSVLIKAGAREVYVTTDKIATVGKTRLGLDDKDETVDVKVVTLVGPARQTFAKPE